MKRSLLQALAALILAAVMVSASSCGVLKASKKIVSGLLDKDTAESTAEPDTAAQSGTEAETTAAPVTETETETEKAEEEYIKIYELYKSAVEKSNSLSTLDVNKSIYLLADTASINRLYILEANSYGRSDAVTKAFVTTDEYSADSLYIKNDRVYEKIDGSTEYRSIKIEDYDQTIINDILKEDNFRFFVLSEEAFKGAQIMDDEDGAKKIVLDPDKAVYEALFKDELKHLAAKANGKDTNKISIENRKSTMTVTVSENGYVISFDCDLDFDLQIDNNKSENVLGFLHFRLENPGKFFFISIPEAKYTNDDMICSGTEDDPAYTIYKNAVEKTNSVDNIEETENMTQKVDLRSLAGVLYGEMKKSSITKIKCIDRFNSGKMLLEAHYKSTKESTDEEKEETNIDMFADSEKLYVKTDVLNTFIAVDRTSELAEKFDSEFNAKVTLINTTDAEVFKGAILRKNADGSIRFKASPDGSVVESAFKEAFNNMEDSIGKSSILSHTVNSAKLIVDIDANGYLRKTDLNIDITFNYLYQGNLLRSNCVVGVVYEYGNPEDEVIIVFPEV